MKKYTFHNRASRWLLPPKVLHIMKLTIVLMTIAFVQVSAHTFGQRVTLSQRNASLETVVKQLREQTGYDFLLDGNILREVKNINVQVQNVSLEKAIQAIVKGRDLQYSIEGRSVVLTKQTISSSERSKDDQLISQQNVISGVVLDDKGAPLVGATVKIKGKQVVMLTSDDGTFILRGVISGDVVSTTYLGFEVHEITITDAQLRRNNNLVIKLTPVSNDLDEVTVVNTGYQSISGERVTGSYDVIDSKTIQRRHAPDLSTALLGSVAGMQGSENADGSINYTIRGVTSLYADARPLVVVDGFPVENGFRDINPNDVESVTVLKDAAAASIWGARSANGVIVVVTKKAKERLNVNANVMTRIGRKIDLSTALTTASAADQVAWERMAYENQWYANTYSNSFSELARPYSLAKEYLFQHYEKGSISMEEMEAGLNELSRSDNRQQIKDHLLQNPVLQQYNLSISSANDRIQNVFSVMYERNTGNVIENNLNRWRMNYSAQAKIFQWLDFNFATNIHYVQSENNGPTMNELRLLSPYELILNEDGSYATQLMGVNREQYDKIRGTLPYEDWDYNILRETRARSLAATELNSRFQTGLTFKLLDGFTLDSKLQYEYNLGKTRHYYMEDSYYARDWVNFIVDYDQINQQVNKQFIPKGGILQTTDRSNRNYTWRNQLNFNKSFNKHVVTALAGAEISEYGMEGTNHPWVWGYDDKTNRMSPLPFGGRSVAGVVQLKNIMGTNLPQLNQSAFWYIDQAVGSPKSRQRTDYNIDETSFDYRNDRYVSVFGNASYTYDNKYSVSGSARSDASNLITNDPKYRWAPLWSIGGLWHASREEFMESTAYWLSRLSLRLTYGFNGNVEKSTSPLTLITMSQTPSLNTGTYTGSFRQGNPLLRWERTKTINAGVDFALFSNLLYGSIDVYNKRGIDILGDVPQPTINGGLVTQRINQAGISNKGFEVELGVNTNPGESAISLNTKLTYAYNQNKVTSLYNPSIQSQNAAAGRAFTEGYPVGAMWSYIYAGMKDGQPQLGRIGDDETYPMTGTGIAVANYDDGYLVYSGPMVGPHSAGWQGTLSGYGFDFSFLFVGNFGGKFRNPTFTYPMLTLGKDIIPMFVNDVLNGSPDIPAWPEANSENFSNWSFYTSSLNTLVESSSFIKLKELNLEYKIPKTLTDRVNIGSVNLFAQVRDLGCIWQANSRGYDPEWLPGTLPPTTTYLLGFNVNF